MRCQRRNKTEMYYSLYVAKDVTYDTDEEWNPITYETEEGEEIFSVLSEEPRPYYSEPCVMHSNIAESGGEAEAKEYGLSVADYEAVLVYERGKYPLKEGAYIWLDSPIQYEYNGKEVPIEIDGEKVMMKSPDVTTADYIVLKTPKSLNMQKALLKAVVKQG